MTLNRDQFGEEDEFAAAATEDYPGGVGNDAAMTGDDDATSVLSAANPTAAAADDDAAGDERRGAAAAPFLADRRADDDDDTKLLACAHKQLLMPGESTKLDRSGECGVDPPCLPDGFSLTGSLAEEEDAATAKCFVAMTLDREGEGVEVRYIMHKDNLNVADFAELLHSVLAVTGTDLYNLISHPACTIEVEPRDLADYAHPLCRPSRTRETQFITQDMEEVPADQLWPNPRLCAADTGSVGLLCKLPGRPRVVLKPVFTVNQVDWRSSAHVLFAVMADWFGGQLKLNQVANALPCLGSVQEKIQKEVARREKKSKKKKKSWQRSQTIKLEAGQNENYFDQPNEENQIEKIEILAEDDVNGDFYDNIKNNVDQDVLTKNRDEAKDDIKERITGLDAKKKCRVCEMVFVPTIEKGGREIPAWLALRRHFKLLHEKRECHQCKETFLGKDVFKSHYASVHSMDYDSSLDICGYCGKEIKDKHLAGHLATVHEKRYTVMCNTCGKKFASAIGLDKHNKVIHQRQLDYACAQCPKKFGTKSSLQSHSTVHTGDKNFLCGDCGDSFRLKDSLKRHAEVTHIGTKFLCIECGKYFGRKVHLNTHVKVVHRGIRNFQCSDCGKSFAQRTKMEDHVKTLHKGSKEFQCSLCQKSFSQKGSVNHHMRTVHLFKLVRNGSDEDNNEDDMEDQARKCPTCDKVFSQKSSLNHHIRSVHLFKLVKEEYGRSKMEEDDGQKVAEPKAELCGKMEIKIYSCKLCDKDFSLKDSFNRHTRSVHEKERVYCAQCPKSYGYKDDLKNHVSIVHEGLEKRHKCPKCEKSFTGRKYLLRHIACEHEGKREPCDKCGNTYENIYLKKHIATVHETAEANR